jgi:hypothetical protein
VVNASKTLGALPIAGVKTRRPSLVRLRPLWSPGLRQPKAQAGEYCHPTEELGGAPRAATIHCRAKVQAKKATADKAEKPDTETR